LDSKGTDHRLIKGLRKTVRQVVSQLRFTPSTSQEQCCYIAISTHSVNGGKENEEGMEMKSTVSYIISITTLFRKPSLHLIDI
jgi:hypothetical protein